jgi:hypothetical protein
MQLFLNEVSQRHPDERIVMVIDGALEASKVLPFWRRSLAG